MRIFLASLFVGILALMVGVTTWASLERSVFEAGDLFADRWFVATFCDAYCGFVTFYVWVACRESTLVGRLLWFVAIMALGNIAAAVYVLIAVWRLEPTDTLDQLLLGRTTTARKKLTQESETNRR